MKATIITEEHKEFASMEITPDLWIHIIDKSGHNEQFNLRFYSLKIDHSTGDITLDGRYESS